MVYWYGRSKTIVILFTFLIVDIIVLLKKAYLCNFNSYGYILKEFLIYGFEFCWKHKHAWETYSSYSSSLVLGINHFCCYIFDLVGNVAC